MASDEEHLEGEQAEESLPAGGDVGEASGGGGDEDEFDVAAFFAAGASSPGAVKPSTPEGPTGGSTTQGAGGAAAPKAPSPGHASSGARPLNLPELSITERAGGGGDHFDLLSDVDLNVTIELGRTRMLVEDVLRLGQGSVVELDKLAGDPVDVYVNERLVAKGEVLVLNDNFCVRINELVSEEVRRSA